MGNPCSCYSKRAQNVEEVLDDSLEDKLLGRRKDGVERTMAEEEAWRQRRQELQDEADVAMRCWDEENEANESLRDDARESLGDVKDRRRAHDEAVEAVEDEEDYESAIEDDTRQRGGVLGDESDGDSLAYRDSYASGNAYNRGGESLVFRDTELANTAASDSFLTCSSYRNTTSSGSFIDEETHEPEQGHK
ncbi:hypothetical protein PsorP6_012443 [Peronosclerospora sorghi]|uniref:Uncharacterized protein n=1 Tax=Peronosclerospora sorghi TaxID=230839 RepID=A0ACC0WIA4_9STRA|nr:hypothetical protein PsorP6_012443 [Peronosclerospora sorghi]